MRVVVVSDTHGAHEDLGILEGDVLIHCGDHENLFTPNAGILDAIDDWFARQRFSLILCTGGNHDIELQRRVATGRSPFRNAIYLQDEAVTFRGLKFWGAPWVPVLSGHAFFADDAMLAAAWAGIPEDVNVLITHTPPAGVLDVSSAGIALGCEHLAARLAQIRPMLHCFGHVHASAGTRRVAGTTFANATSVNSKYQIARPAWGIDLPDGQHRMKIGYGE
ncbi:MAG: metallophosphatase domain-containing protein [Paracoccaceae bacterium]